MKDYGYYSQKSNFANSLSNLTAQPTLLYGKYYESAYKDENVSISELSEYRTLLFLLKYGDLIINSIEIPHCKFDENNGVILLYKSNAIAEIHYVSNTSITVEFFDAYYPVFIYGIK